MKRLIAIGVLALAAIGGLLVGIPEAKPQAGPAQASWVWDVDVSMEPAAVMTFTTPLAPPSNLKKLSKRSWTL